MSEELTTHPTLSPLTWSLILMALIFALAAAGRTILVAREAPPVSMALRTIVLPEGQCFAPAPGDVLHITITARDLNGQDLTAHCLQAGPQLSWSKYR